MNKIDKTHDNSQWIIDSSLTENKGKDKIDFNALNQEINIFIKSEQSEDIIFQEHNFRSLQKQSNEKFELASLQVALKQNNVSDFLKQNKYTYTNQTKTWLGEVIDIDGDNFTAKLEDIASNSTYEIGKFSIKEYAKDEEDMIKLGAFFYMSIGNTYNKGTLTKTLVIRFKRTYKYSEEEFDTIIDKADTIYRNLKIEN